VTGTEIERFIIPWVSAMRRHPGVLYPPSVRTGISVALVLLGEKLRRGGKLANPHLVNAAVLVTPPEDKAFAREVAEKAVLGRPDALQEPEPSKLDVECAGLARILAELKIAEALKGLTFEDSGTRLEGLFCDPEFRDIISLLGGESACRASYRSREALEAAAQDKIRDQFGALVPATFPLAAKLGMLEEIERTSPSRRERLAAQVIRGKRSAQDAAEQLKSFGERISLLELLRSAGADVSTPLHAMADGAFSLDEMLALASLGYRDFASEQVLRAVEGELPHASFEQVFEATQRFGGELTQQARRALFGLCGDQLDAETLAQHAALITEWKTAMLRALERKLSLAHAEHGFALTMETIKRLFTLCRMAQDPFVAQHIWEGCKQLAPAALEATENIDEIKEFVSLAEELGLPFRADDVRRHALDRGIPRDLVDEILLPDLALFKTLTARGERVYERFAKLLNRIRPRPSQMSELVLLAIKCQNSAALAALGLHDLAVTLKIAERGGVPTLQLVVSALSAGSGTNLLVQWYRCRHSIPGVIKEAVRKLAKQALIEHAVRLGKELMGDPGNGVVQTEDVRPFVDGDEFSLIDIEETLDAILLSGKSPHSANVSDFWVRQTSNGRRACVILLDVSGSMDGDPLTWCAITAAMAVYSLKPDEVAVALFESDAHVLKILEDHRKTLDEVADDLLDLSSMGGTMLSSASAWALDQLRHSRHVEKRLLVLTDCAVYDAGHCSDAFSAVASLGAKTTIFVPGRWAAAEANEMARWSHGTLVELGSRWNRFPELVAEALR